MRSGWKGRVSVGTLLLLAGILVLAAMYVTWSHGYVLLTGVGAGFVLVVLGAYLVITSLVRKEKVA